MSQKRPTRGTTLRRLLRLAGRIKGLRVAPPLAVLAEEYGVCWRTIHRDLALLERAGYVVPDHPWRVQ